MEFFKKLFSGNAGISFEAQPMTVLAPLDGCAMPLKEFPDEIFAGETLGIGCGIEPHEDIVYAPFNGIVTQIADTKHAIGLESSDGIELLIHVGVDTVEMNGKGFKTFAKVGDCLKAGSPLLKFDKAAIKASGHPTAVAIIVTNTDDFSAVNLLAEGTVLHGSPLLKASK